MQNFALSLTTPFLTLLDSESPKLYAILAFLSTIGLINAQVFQYLRQVGCVNYEARFFSEPESSYLQSLIKPYTSYWKNPATTHRKNGL